MWLFCFLLIKSHIQDYLYSAFYDTIVAKHILKINSISFKIILK